jgi:hypothetical protein
MIHILVWLCMAGPVAADIKDRLETARTLIRKELHHLKKRWDIDHYPNFLNSAALSKDSWDLMKLKLQDRILSADISPQHWIISFMGSSVTTGRDSPVEVGFVPLTQHMMGSVFRSLNIQMNSTNNAMENNPCVPYDLCVKPFAGDNADMIHWEQSYDCEGNTEFYEQFIRQALLLKSKPIVIFSHSATENWRADQCKDMPPPHVLTEDERSILDAFKQHRPVEIFTSMNKIMDRFGPVMRLNEEYTGAGIQTFWHQDHEMYKCLGPYIPDWGCCSAPWHPSLQGHELRAAHHALLWLLVLYDSVSELHHRMALSPASSVAELHANVTKHLQGRYDTMLPLKTPMHESEFTDGIQW